MLRAEQVFTGSQAQSLRELALPILALPFEERSKSRLRATLSDGREIGVFLPRATVLRDGDVLVCDDTQLVRVQAAAQDVMLIGASSARELARLAYHLGNRHMQMEIGADFLKLEHDAVLAEMVLGLGGTVMRAQLPFEPEAGAYHTQTHIHAHSH
jgi:urease accessory protein